MITKRLDERLNGYNVGSNRVKKDCLSSLDNYLLKNNWNSFSYEEIVNCGIQICVALECLHSKNTTRGSVRPENILVRKAVDGSLAFYLNDRNFTKERDEVMSVTDWYRAPYWGDSRYGVQRDLYALGLTMFWMATGGRLPYEANNCKELTDEERMRAFMKRSILPQELSIDGINNKIATVIQKACSVEIVDTKIKATSYDSAAQMRKALEQLKGLKAENVEVVNIKAKSEIMGRAGSALKSKMETARKKFVERIFTNKDYKGEQVLIIGEEYTGIADYALMGTPIVELIIGANVKTYGKCVWANCSSLKKLEAENYTTAHKGDFFGCNRLEEVKLPNCQNIEEWAFRTCNSLNMIDMPRCESVPPYAFYYCSKLRSINLPMCQSVGRYAFEGCTNLKHVDLPVCESVECSAFEECDRLKHIDMPQCKKIGMSAFRKCGDLEVVELNACEEVESYAFERCGGLEYINLPAVQKKGSDVFAGCWRLKGV